MKLLWNQNDNATGSTRDKSSRTRNKNINSSSITSLEEQQHSAVGQKKTKNVKWDSVDFKNNAKLVPRRPPRHPPFDNDKKKKAN